MNALHARRVTRHAVTTPLDFLLMNQKQQVQQQVQRKCSSKCRGLPVEGRQDCNCEQSPGKRSEGAGLDSPLQVHAVLHPPGSDVRATQSKEERR